jgi:hypothetical protein
MAGWEPIRSVPALAGAVPAAPAATTPPPLTAKSAAIEPVSMGAIVGLGIVTLGIYPVVKFYLAVQGYQALAGRPSRFTLWFWLSIGLGVGAPLIHLGLGPLGPPAGLASLVFAVLTLFEALTLRAEVVRRAGVTPSLTSDSTHKILFLVGVIASFLVVGIILLGIQGVLFFQDHNNLAAAVAGRDAAARAAV